MIEYKDDLASVYEENGNWFRLSEEELLSKVRMRYRIEAMKTYNKTYVNKFMPTNEQIPKCALIGTRELVNDNGYESLCDQGPPTSDAVLNKRDNQREAALQKEALRGLLDVSRGTMVRLHEYRRLYDY